MKTSRPMQWLRFVILGLALWGGGCTTTTVGSAGSMSSRGWLAGHAKWNVFARADDGGYDRVVVSVESQSDVRLRRDDGAIVPVESVRSVIAVDRAQGALEGLQAGAIGGLLSGLGIGLVIQTALQPDGDCFRCRGPGPGEVFTAMGLGLLLGAAIGAAIGAGTGHSEVLELK
jgi:hypothetical protein